MSDSRPSLCNCPNLEESSKESCKPRFENVCINSIVYQKPGFYDLRKYVDSVWVMGPGPDTMHLCPRVFWSHVGLSKKPFWFVWDNDEFPEWIQWSVQIEVRGEDVKRKEEVATLKKMIEDECERLFAQSPTSN